MSRDLLSLPGPLVDDGKVPGAISLVFSQQNQHHSAGWMVGFAQEAAASSLCAASLTHADISPWLLVLVLLELFSAQVDASC